MNKLELKSLQKYHNKSWMTIRPYMVKCDKEWIQVKCFISILANFQKPIYITFKLPDTFPIYSNKPMLSPFIECHFNFLIFL
jgi:hypothetical protein